MRLVSRVLLVLLPLTAFADGAPPAALALAQECLAAGPADTCSGIVERACLEGALMPEAPNPGVAREWCVRMEIEALLAAVSPMDVDCCDPRAESAGRPDWVADAVARRDCVVTSIERRN